MEMHVLRFGNKLNKEVAADLSLQIFLIHYISLQGYDETF